MDKINNVCEIENIDLLAPSKISIGITKKCNLRCKHCLSSAGEPDNNELNLQEWMRLIDQISIAGTKFITIGGGEPLLRSDLFEIIRYANSKDILTSIVTNGTLLTEEIAKKLNELKLDVIHISLDGLEKNHDYIRGIGSFTRVIEGIKILRKNCPTTKLAVRFTVNKLNVNECSEAVSLAEELKVDIIRFTPILLFGRAIDNRELILNQDDYIKFLINARKIKSFLKIVLPHEEDKKNLKDTTFGCHCGKEAIWITQTGDYYPCIFFGEEHRIGNVRNESYMDLWKKTRKHMAVVRGNDTCMSCLDFSKCRGGCRARALYELNDINAIDPLCPLQKNITI